VSDNSPEQIRQVIIISIAAGQGWCEGFNITGRWHFRPSENYRTKLDEIDLRLRGLWLERMIWRPSGTGGHRYTGNPTLPRFSDDLQQVAYNGERLSALGLKKVIIVVRDPYGKTWVWCSERERATYAMIGGYSYEWMVTNFFDSGYPVWGSKVGIGNSMTSCRHISPAMTSGGRDTPWKKLKLRRMMCCCDETMSNSRSYQRMSSRQIG